MSPRLAVLSFAAFLTIGCNANSGPAAHATPPEESPADAPPPLIEQGVPITVEAAGAVEEAPVAAPAAADATTQASTPSIAAPAAIVEPAPQTLAETFDAQLAALIEGEVPLADAIAEVDPEDRELLRTTVDALASFRLALRDENSPTQTKIEPLLDLSEKIRSEIPLSLPTLALCRSVTQFGVYDPFDPPRFTAGRATPVVIYCEVDHFRSDIASDGRWETKLSYEAVLYSDNEAAVAVINKKPTQIVDRCRNRRRDFFLADRMTIPANLPVGKYVLKVTVIDQLANLVAEKTVPVLVAPN